MDPTDVHFLDAPTPVETAPRLAVALGLHADDLRIKRDDLIGLGAFRAGTGGAESLFSSLIILPVVWLAAASGRRYIVVAIANHANAAAARPAFDALVDWATQD